MHMIIPYACLSLQNKECRLTSARFDILMVMKIEVRVSCVMEQDTNVSEDHDASIFMQQCLLKH
jgi:hypothetical protein